MGCEKRLVSISIVTWNSRKYMERCLNAILGQTHREIEIIVTDNKSADGTIEILKNYSSDITLIQNDMNRGYSGGHNIGIKKSAGEYILVLNPDVFLDSTYVEELVSFLDCYPNYGGAIGKIYQLSPDIENGTSFDHPIIDTAGLSILHSRQFIARGYGKIDNHLFSTSIEVFGIDGMAPLYRRKMLEDTKVSEEYFDEIFFAYCEDQDLSWRARLLGWKFYFIPEAKGYHVRNWKPNTLKGRKLVRPEIKRMALRNHYLMIIKNDSMKSICRNAIFIGFRAVKIFIYLLLFEQSTISAIPGIFNLLPETFKKRREIMNKKRVDQKLIDEWFDK